MQNPRKPKCRKEPITKTLDIYFLDPKRYHTSRLDIAEPLKPASHKLYLTEHSCFNDFYDFFGGISSFVSRGINE